MELKDLLLAPLYLLLIYAVAYRLRRRNADKVTRRYYLPALSVKLVGAVALGLVYQFYYQGGDTFNFYHDSSIIYNAIWEDPSVGWQLLVNPPREPTGEVLNRVNQMLFYHDPHSYPVIRLSALLGLLCFNSYVVIALSFAVLSFSGVWAIYRVFYDLYPALHKQLAVAIFFLPSVFFWGSGLMKDTLCIAALGWLFYGFYFGTVKKTRVLKSALLIAVAGATLYAVKVYILLAFLPPALFWIVTANNARIKNRGLRLLARPVFLGVGLLAAYLGGTRLTAGDQRYALDKLAERTKINADYLYAVGTMQNGSAYHIGELDGTFGSMLAISPRAINVALFRPYLWEVKNPVMLLSAVEAAAFLLLTVYLLVRIGPLNSLWLIGTEPILTFCFLFAMSIALASGLNSYNFGTLVRYKIPLMPFYLSALYIMQLYVKKSRRRVRRGEATLARPAQPVA